jgi:hypothetical protein
VMRADRPRPLEDLLRSLRQAQCHGHRP